jgi:hypothetical protein
VEWTTKFSVRRPIFAPETFWLGILLLLLLFLVLVLFIFFAESWI